MTAFFLTLKNIFNGFIAAAMLIPVLLTMGEEGNPDAVAEAYPDSTNPYITEHLDPDISAHRSGAGLAPQNTLMAFENIIANQAEIPVDILEFDVQVTKDGELVLMHDLTYDNTTNAVEAFGKKNNYVSSITLEEAQVLNMGENFKGNGDYPYRGLRGDAIPYNLHIATCDSVIDYVEANCGDKVYKYCIEVKSIGISGRKAVDRLYEIITERNLQDRVIWSTFAPDVSSYMKNNYPEISRTADAIEAVQFYFYYRLNFDLQDINPSYIALQIPYGKNAFDNLINLGHTEMLNYAHKNNIAVQYWTINNEEDIKHLTKAGADCIMTDYPQRAIDAVSGCK